MKCKVKLLLALLSLLFLFGCASEEDTAPAYGCLPSGEEAAWETVMNAGGDVYNVNLDTTSAQVRTIVKLPGDYLDAMNGFHQSGTQASQNGELIYSQEG